MTYRSDLIDISVVLVHQTDRAVLVWLALAVAAAGVAGILVFAPLASAATPALDEPDHWPRTHQLVICRPGEGCEKRGKPAGPVACEMDGAAERLLRTLPDGTKVECRKVRGE